MTVAASANVHLLTFSLPFVKSPYSAVCEKHLLSGCLWIAEAGLLKMSLSQV